MNGCEAEVLERVILSIAYVAFAALFALVAFAVEPLGLGRIAWPLAVAAAAGVPLSLHKRTLNAALVLLAVLAVAVVLLFLLAANSAQSYTGANKVAAPLRHV